MSGALTSRARPRLLDRLADEAHLWLVRLRASIPPPIERHWRGLLSPQERAANDRFRVESARQQHLAARALVRTTLSRYVEVDPRSWSFRTESQGRPEIDGPDGVPPLRFNISHTRGLVACAVTLTHDVGVDVERPGRRLREPLELARHGFAPAEREALARLGGRARRQRFFDLWTLKEAYVKARGAGFLALPASRLSCEIDAGGRIELSLEAGLDDRADAWQMALLEPDPEHRLAVAIRRGPRTDLELVTREVEVSSGVSRRVRPEILARSPISPVMTGAETESPRTGAPR